MDDRELRELLDRAKKVTADAEAARKGLHATIEKIEADFERQEAGDKVKRSKGRRES